jgi:hypothetical protein
LGQISIVALITMSVFFRTTLHPNTVNDGILYLGAMFFAVLNVLFNGFTDMALTVARLPVFYKQRDMFLYPPWAFVLPAYFLRLPLSIYETFTWVIFTYWTIGFAPEASRFFRQWLVLFAMHQVSLGLFRLVSSVGRIMVLTQSLGACSILVTLSLGGFIVSRGNNLCLYATTFHPKGLIIYPPNYLFSHLLKMPCVFFSNGYNFMNIGKAILQLLKVEGGYLI